MKAVEFIKGIMPWFTSSTRLVLLGLTVVLSFMCVWALMNDSQYFSEILAIMASYISAVATYFFTQRGEEHKTFTANPNNDGSN